MDQGPTVWVRDIELPDHASSASRARAFVGLHLVGNDLAYLADDIQLVVSELATNALTHAHTAFTVTLAAYAHSLLLRCTMGRPPRRPCAPALPSIRAVGA